MTDFHKTNIEIGSVEEKMELNQLKKSMKALQLEFIQQMKNALWIDMTDHDLTYVLTELNKVYCQKLMGICDQPLTNGLAPISIIRHLHMWVGVCLASNAFRHICKTSIIRQFARITDAQIENAPPDSAIAFRANLIQQHHDFYLPYVPETLGVARIAYAELIYQAMREEKANIKELWTKFEGFDNKILDYGQRVGISNDRNDRAMRMIAGHYIEKYPNKSDLFRETAYHMVMRGEDAVMTYQVKKYNFHGNYMKTIQYSLWDGQYQDEAGQDFLLGFTPRVPASVNELRRRSKEAWDFFLSFANTPEEFVATLLLDDARTIQKQYLQLMQIDQGLTDEDLTHLNDFMNDQDDVTWMIDIGGTNPFNTAGLSMSYDEFIQHGPSEEITEPMACNYSELKSAMCLWFNLHPNVSPYAFQTKANVLYKAYEKSGKMSVELEQEIDEVLQKRDELFALWAKAYQKANQYLQNRDASSIQEDC